MWRAHLHVSINQARCVHKVNCCKAALLAGGDLCGQQGQDTLSTPACQTASLMSLQARAYQTDPGSQLPDSFIAAQQTPTCEQVGQQPIKVVKTIQVVKVTDGGITSEGLTLPVHSRVLHA